LGSNFLHSRKKANWNKIPDSRTFDRKLKHFHSRTDEQLPEREHSAGLRQHAAGLPEARRRQHRLPAHGRLLQDIRARRGVHLRHRLRRLLHVQERAHLQQEPGGRLPVEKLRQVFRPLRQPAQLHQLRDEAPVAQAAGRIAAGQAQFFHHAKVHQPAGQLEDDDEQFEGHEQKHPVRSLPRFQSVRGQPEENEAHPGHPAEEQSEADRVPVQLSHRTGGRRSVQRRESLPHQAD